MAEERAWEMKNQDMKQSAEGEDTQIEDEWRKKRREREQQRILRERVRQRFLCLCVLAVVVGTAVLVTGRLKGGREGLGAGVKRAGMVQAGMSIEEE